MSVEPDYTQTPIEVDPPAGLVFDSESGQWIVAAEAEFRARIQDERARNLMAVDAHYYDARPTLHAPLTGGEKGSISSEWWEVERENRGVMRVPLGQLAGALTPEDLAARIAGAALGPLAEQVMLQLFALANNNWRDPKLTVRLSELLDRLGYQRDKRGIHYSKNRHVLSRTLLGLHFTHVGVQQTTQGQGRARRSVGFVAPLLAAVGYGPTRDVEGLSLEDVFEQALPEEVQILLNPAWYAGVRQPSGLPGNDYVLVAAPAAATPGRRRGRGLGRSPVADLLRAYIEECRMHTAKPYVRVSRQTLLDQADIRDRKPAQAGRTLQRALDALRAEGLLRSYSPCPLPLRSDDPILLQWDAAATQPRLF